MPRTENKAVSGEKGSPPQDESGSGDMKIEDLFRMLFISERMNSRFKIQDNSSKHSKKTSRIEISASKNCTFGHRGHA